MTKRTKNGTLVFPDKFADIKLHITVAEMKNIQDNKNLLIIGVKFELIGILSDTSTNKNDKLKNDSIASPILSPVK